MANTLEHLPTDLRVKILSKLGVKDLMRLKCINKTWEHMIRDADFAKFQSSNGPKGDVRVSHRLIFPELGILRIPQRSGLFMDSCGGLICLANPDSTNAIIIWNPATRMYKLLPDSPPVPTKMEILSFGFGCTADGDFKVVRISCLENTTEAVVYSSKADSWAIIKGLTFKVFDRRCQAIVDGNPYWPGKTPEEDHFSLVSYDSTNARFIIEPFPAHNHLPGDLFALVDWKGRLSMLSCDTAFSRADVWSIVHGEWSQIETFQIPRGRDDRPCSEILCASSGDTIIGTCIFRYMLIYDTVVGSLETIAEAPSFRIAAYVNYAFPYSQSLAYVPGMVPAPLMRNGDENLVFTHVPGLFLVRFHPTREVSCYYIED
ncbi:hypothetical protein AAHA92_27304 [Salvia divinorum]|uniref:F-box domain-containing protein n=1 Tax=Salvia divinorum TaxID=28513 RepID=A0ABD1G3B5_SALDI